MVIFLSKSADLYSHSWSDLTIGLASKNYPKMTPQTLKSIHWFKSYIFYLFRGHGASKKWKIMFRRTLYGKGYGAWQFVGVFGRGQRFDRNSSSDPIVHHAYQLYTLWAETGNFTPQNFFSIKMPQNQFKYDLMHSPASYSLNRPHLALFSLKTLFKRLLN